MIPRCIAGLLALILLVVPLLPKSNPLQDATRNICTKDKQYSDAAQQQVTDAVNRYRSGSLSAFAFVQAYLKVQYDYIATEKSLLLDLQALTPPPDLQPIMTQASTAWTSLLNLLNREADDVNQSSTVDEQLQLISSYASDHQGQDLANQINGDLRILAGNGCAPAF
jgi:hypothetical protein